MRYMLMVYVNPDAEERPMEEWMEFHNKYGLDGTLKLAERLQDISTATTVRTHDGKLSITDGPFTETKEHLGGIYIIEAEDLDAAIKIASECPTAKTGSMEIRPIFEFTGE